MKVRSIYCSVALSFSMCSGLAAGAADVSLPRPFTDALGKAGISTDSVALFVAPAEGGVPIVDHRPFAAMNPASVMKVVTTYAALDLLGPVYTWNTPVLYTGSLDNGVLSGDLIIQGSGDPSMTLNRFAELLRSLRNHGVQRINGDLILDRQAIQVSPDEADNDPGKFDNDPLRPYNVIPDALLVNYNSLAFSLIADSGQRKVDIRLQTPIEGVRVENHVRGVPGGCGDWRESLTVGAGKEVSVAKKPAAGADTAKIDAEAPTEQEKQEAQKTQETQETVVTIGGRLSFSCNEVMLYLSPLPSDRYIEGVFRALWRELGGVFNGQVRAGTASPAAKSIVDTVSPPLAEVMRDINKYSNNPMARLLFLSLARGRPADATGAERRIRAWLKAKGIDESLWVFENGSGLSRNERVSARGLGLLLQDAWKSPFMPEFAATLPLLGLDGTQRRQPVNQLLVGRARFKTGAIDGVRALAGYVMDKRGRWWVVIALINDPKAGGVATQNTFAALTEWVWNLRP